LADKLLSAIAEVWRRGSPMRVWPLTRPHPRWPRIDRRCGQINAANFLTDAEKREMLGLPALAQEVQP
jgi:hypothetical protein